GAGAGSGQLLAGRARRPRRRGLDLRPARAARPLKITIVAVGRMKERALADACEEYLKRVRRVVPCELYEVRAADDLIARCPPRAERCLLDERGRELSSVELASALGQRMTAGAAGIAFLLGGADGVPEAVRAQASWSLSLSRLALTHRLARLVLC